LYCDEASQQRATVLSTPDAEWSKAILLNRMLLLKSSWQARSLLISKGICHFLLFCICLEFGIGVGLIIFGIM
jgi:hypothetical protein